MITLKNVKTLNGSIIDHTIESPVTHSIDGMNRLLLLPAPIDIDSIFESNDSVKHAEDCMKGGITRIFDGRGRSPKALLSMDKPEKVGPLTIYHYIDGAISDEYDYIGKVKDRCIGIRLSIDLASSPFTPSHSALLDRLFQIAGQENLIITVSLAQGNEAIDEQRKHAYQTVVQTIALAEKYSNQLCLQHLRTAEELVLIKEAKANGILAFGEVALSHLFIHNKDVHERFNDGTIPFIPTQQDQEALWAGLVDNTIDVIGSGNGLTIPRLFIPLLIYATKNKGLKLETLVATTRGNVEEIFRLEKNNDVILVDLEKEEPFPEKIVEQLGLSDRWKNSKLSGWVKYTIAHGEIIPS